MYPVAYQADHVEPQSRLITFFRGLLVIPWLFVGIFWGLGALVCTIGAWFAIVFTGRYPQGLYDFNAKAHRYTTRVNGFYYLLTDVWPPFDGDEHPEYPVRLVIGPPLPEYSRWKAALRIVLVIPVAIVVYLLGILVSVVLILSWFVILFTGKHPSGLFDVLKLGLAYTARAGVYYGLITESWPPFSPDDGDQAPPTQSYGDPAPAPTPAGPTQPNPFGERPSSNPFGES